MNNLNSNTKFNESLLRFQMKRIQFKRIERSDLQTQFWFRFFAFTIDGILIQFLIPLIILPILNIFDIDFIEPMDYTDAFVLHALRVNSLIILLSWVFSFVLYGSVMESSRLRGTLGKWFVGISVNTV